MKKAAKVFFFSIVALAIALFFFIQKINEISRSGSAWVFSSSLDGIVEFREKAELEIGKGASLKLLPTHQFILKNESFVDRDSGQMVNVWEGYFHDKKAMGITLTRVDTHACVGFISDFFANGYTRKVIEKKVWYDVLFVNGIAIETPKIALSITSSWENFEFAINNTESYKLCSANDKFATMSWVWVF